MLDWGELWKNPDLFAAAVSELSHVPGEITITRRWLRVSTRITLHKFPDTVSNGKLTRLRAWRNGFAIPTASFVVAALLRGYEIARSHFSSASPWHQVSIIKKKAEGRSITFLTVCPDSDTEKMCMSRSCFVKRRRGDVERNWWLLAVVSP